MTMYPPFAARREQPVNDKDAQDFFPIGVFTAHGQPGAKKIVEMEPAPELISQPAGAPLAGTAQGQLAQAHLQRIHSAQRRRAVFWEQRELTLFTGTFVEDGDG